LISTFNVRALLIFLADVQDGYLADCQLAPAAEYATDAKIADRLWVLSEELVGEKFSLSKK
jgi:hypothetical protein